MELERAPTGQYRGQSSSLRITFIIHLYCIDIRFAKTVATYSLMRGLEAASVSRTYSPRDNFGREQRGRRPFAFILLKHNSQIDSRMSVRSIYLYTNRAPLARHRGRRGRPEAKPERRVDPYAS